MLDFIVQHLHLSIVRVELGVEEMEMLGRHSGGIDEDESGLGR